MWKPFSSASCISGAVSSEVRSTRIGRCEGSSHSSSRIICLQLLERERRVGPAKSRAPAAFCFASFCSAGGGEAVLLDS